MRLIYIAGSFRAETPWLIEQNIRAAETIGLEVARMGMAPLIPHSMYRFFQLSMPDAFWESSTMEMMRAADALMVRRGWQGSIGTMSEIAEAKRIGLPIFYSLEELRSWAILSDCDPPTIASTDPANSLLMPSS